MVGKFHTKDDMKLNPTLRDELGTMRGGMLGAAESVAIPERFYTVPDDSSPSVLIMDTVTGRSTLVALCNYRGVREALADLFP